MTLWARRGYAAIAMDLAGSQPDRGATKHGAVHGAINRLPDGGPGQAHEDKFDTMATSGLDDDWPYHAVANVIRAHSLVRSLPDVDPSRTAITGISWGGYTTCIVASLDSFMKSHDDVRHAAKNIRIQVNMPHGHAEGWAPPEIAAFIDARAFFFTVTTPAGLQVSSPAIFAQDAQPRR